MELDCVSKDGGDLAAEVRALSDTGLEELRAVWRSHWGAPPKLKSVRLLRATIAWRLQSEALGGLDDETRRRLRFEL